MMFQRGVFPFAALREIDSQVLELPYGSNKDMSMILLMPRKGVTLHEVFNKLKTFKMKRVYDELAKAMIDYEDDEVEVHVPKFSFVSDFVLTDVLKEVSLVDLSKGDLLGNFECIMNDHP
jgi:serpin B